MTLAMDVVDIIQMLMAARFMKVDRLSAKSIRAMNCFLRVYYHMKNIINIMPKFVISYSYFMMLVKNLG